MQVNTCLVFEPIVTIETIQKHSHLKDYKETMSICGQYCKPPYPTWVYFYASYHKIKVAKMGKIQVIQKNIR